MATDNQRSESWKWQRVTGPARKLRGVFNGSNTVEIIPYGDRQRTLVRYTLAVEGLKEALHLDRPGWDAFELQFDNFQDENLEFLHDAIEEKLNSSMNPVADSTIWAKCKRLG